MEVDGVVFWLFVFLIIECEVEFGDVDVFFVEEF